MYKLYHISQHFIGILIEDVDGYANHLINYKHSDWLCANISIERYQLLVYILNFEISSK